MINEAKKMNTNYDYYNDMNNNNCLAKQGDNNNDGRLLRLLQKSEECGGITLLEDIDSGKLMIKRGNKLCLYENGRDVGEKISWNEKYLLTETEKNEWREKQREKEWNEREKKNMMINNNKEGEKTKAIVGYEFQLSKSKMTNRYEAIEEGEELRLYPCENGKTDEFRDGKTQSVWKKYWEKSEDRFKLKKVEKGTLFIRDWDPKLVDVSCQFDNDEEEGAEDEKGLLFDERREENSGGLFFPEGKKQVSFPSEMYNHIWHGGVHEYDEERMRNENMFFNNGGSSSSSSGGGGSSSRDCNLDPVLDELLKMAKMKGSDELQSETPARNLRLVIPWSNSFPGYVEKLDNENTVEYVDRIQDAYEVWLKARKNAFNQGIIRSEEMINDLTKEKCKIFTKQKEYEGYLDKIFDKIMEDDDENLF